MLAYVALDAVQGKRGIQGHHFLSIVDPARHAACVETQIPGSAEPPQRVAFSGDTLFTLSQQVTVTGRPTTVLRAYRIDTSGCRWRR